MLLSLVDCPPPLPKVTAYPDDATPSESITKRYAESDDPKLPCLTVATILVSPHDVGVITAQFVAFVNVEVDPNRLVSVIFFVVADPLGSSTMTSKSLPAPSVASGKAVTLTSAPHTPDDMTSKISVKKNSFFIESPPKWLLFICASASPA